MKKLPATPRPALAVFDRRGGDVVGRQDSLYLDALFFGDFSRHLEVHHVAGIVAVDEEHSFASGRGLGALHDRIGRR